MEELDTTRGCPHCGGDMHVYGDNPPDWGYCLDCKRSYDHSSKFNDHIGPPMWILRQSALNEEIARKLNKRAID